MNKLINSIKKKLYLGTDTGLIRVYNVDSKSIVQEFIMDEGCPWYAYLISCVCVCVFLY